MARTRLARALRAGKIESQDVVIGERDVLLVVTPTLAGADWEDPALDFHVHVFAYAGRSAARGAIPDSDFVGDGDGRSNRRGAEWQRCGGIHVAGAYTAIDRAMGMVPRFVLNIIDQNGRTFQPGQVFRVVVHTANQTREIGVDVDTVEAA